jgi:hypothetical protein
MKRTTISLPDDLAELVDGESRRRHTSVSEVIRGFIVQGFTGSPEKPRDIPFADLFDDPESPAERLDEILAQGWADAIDRDRG